MGRARHVRTERKLRRRCAILPWIWIEPLLTKVMAREFARGVKLLHAGCGGGEVDKEVVSKFQVTALGIPPNALALYRSCYPGVETTIGNIFDLSAQDKYDGIYNIGVMEHFSPQEIVDILKQFNQVLKPGGSSCSFGHRFTEFRSWPCTLFISF